MAVPDKRTPVYGLHLDSDATGNAYKWENVASVSLNADPIAPEHATRKSWVEGLLTGQYTLLDGSNIANRQAFRDALDLGTASTANLGYGVGNVPQVQSTGKLDPVIIPTQNNITINNLFLTQYL